jgi:uncharacterized protein YkwD
MKNATRLLPLTIVFALLVLGCGVPLPAADLTATAEGQAPPTPEARRIGSEVQSASSGAPSNSSLVVRESVEGKNESSELALLKQEGLTGTPADSDEVDETATPEPTVEETPEPTATPTPVEPTPPPEPTVDPSTYRTRILELLNEARLANHIPALQWDETLASSANAYAQYMADSGFFGHYPPNGSTPPGRIAEAGFEGQYKGEALSAGQDSPEYAVSNFLASPEHASILLSPTSTLVGIGYYYDPSSYYGSYWAIVTANP